MFIIFLTYTYMILIALITVLMIALVYFMYQYINLEPVPVRAPQSPQSPQYPQYPQPTETTNKTAGESLPIDQQWGTLAQVVPPVQTALIKYPDPIPELVPEPTPDPIPTNTTAPGSGDTTTIATAEPTSATGDILSSIPTPTQNTVSNTSYTPIIVATSKGNIELKTCTDINIPIGDMMRYDAAFGPTNWGLNQCKMKGYRWDGSAGYQYYDEGWKNCQWADCRNYVYYQ